MRRSNHDIKEPTLPPTTNDARRKACLTFVDGQLTYFINRNNRRDLLWSFWFSYAKSPYYADPSLYNDFDPTLTSRADWVEYSETHIIKEEDKAWHATKYLPGYRLTYGIARTIYRLDFYITRSEFKEAFLAVKPLGRKTRDGSPPPTETVIFGNVHVVLLEDRQFGKTVNPYEMPSA